MADIRASLILDTKQAEKGIKGVGNALKAVLGATAVREVGQLGNAFQEITNKLKTVTGANESTSASFDRVFQIATRTRGGIEETADLYFRLTKASENLGLSTNEVASVTELFNKTLQISGATSQESASAILQFSQAMAQGVLNSDEFRTINETNSDLMDRLAKALDVPRGALKKLGSEGKLTAKVIANALLESSDAIDKDYSKTTATLAQSLTNIRNNFIRLIGKIEETTGIFGGLASMFNTIANNLDIFGAVLAGVFAAKTVMGIMNMVKAIQLLQLATKGQAIAQAALLALSGPAGWAILTGAAVATGLAVAGIREATKDTTEEAGKLADSVDKAAGSTKELFDESAKVTEEKKKQKTITDENARILARQIKDFQSMGDELKLNSEEFRDQLDLQDQMLLATDEQKEVIQTIGDLESDRKDALVDLAELTKIDAQDRLERENEINDEYDERIRLTKEQLAVTQAVIQAGQSFRNIYNQALAPMHEFLLVSQQQGDVINANTQLERDRLLFTQGLFRNIAAEKIAIAVATEEEERKLAKKLGKTKEQLTDAEKQQAKDVLKQRISDNNNALADFKMRIPEYLDEFEKLREASREFGRGFHDAFIQFEDDVTNAAKFGAEMFSKLTQGWEDAFLKFAETGKLSFKDLFKTLMQEIIKMMANKLFLALFSGGGSVFGSLFAGMFHNGGNIPAGKFGIAGERGPEIITGPASVMGTNDTASLMGGRGTTVNYNIQAVDAPSFQSLVARDPEFIFSVTEAGRRRLPGSRV